MGRWTTLTFTTPEVPIGNSPLEYDYTLPASVIDFHHMIIVASNARGGCVVEMYPTAARNTQPTYSTGSFATTFITKPNVTGDPAEETTPWELRYSDDNVGSALHLSIWGGGVSKTLTFTIEYELPAYINNSLYYNVKSYGATGDGVTDDLFAIQDALAAAKAVGGGAVFFPYPGTYVCSSYLELAENVGLMSFGTLYQPAIKFTHISANGIVFPTASDGAFVKRLRLNGSTNPNATGIFSDGVVSRFPVVEDVYINGFRNGLYFAGANAGQFRNIQCVGQGSGVFPNQGIGFQLGQRSLAKESDACLIDNLYVTNFNLGLFNSFGLACVYNKPIAEYCDIGMYISSYCTLINPYNERNKLTVDGGYDIYVIGDSYAASTIINPYPRGDATTERIMITGLEGKYSRVIDHLPHIVHGYLGLAQSIATGAGETVKIDTFPINSYYGYEGLGSPTYGFKCKLAGLYRLSGRVSFSSPTTGKAYSLILKRGVAPLSVAIQSGTTGSSLSLSVDTVAMLAHDEVVTLFALHSNSGSEALDIGDGETYLDIMRID
jgi:hypothetical protein